jgi:predicted nuclease of predicted toxin-antitoxin system
MSACETHLMRRYGLTLLKTDAVILTKDEDFAARSAQATLAPIIVWLRVGNATNRALFTWLEPRLPGIVRFIEQGSRLVEVL